MCLVHAVFYKHAAPLGLNTSSRIPVFNPAHLSILSVLIQTKSTCRPSGALMYLVHAVFYKHAAPLGLNTSSRIPVFNPAHLSILSVLIQTKSTFAPLFDVFGARRSINMVGAKGGIECRR